MRLQLLLLLLGAAEILAAGGRGQQQERHQEHLQRVQDFPCGLPARRAVPVSSIRRLPSGEQYTPAVTVLHRCDAGAGCCGPENFYCGPLATREVELLFLVTSPLIGGQARADKPKRYETVVATNHTLCGCQSTSTLPK